MRALRSHTWALALLDLVRDGVSEEPQQVSVAAWPQGEGLAAELLPGPLVRLGRPLVVPVSLQIRRPDGAGERQRGPVKSVREKRVDHRPSAARAAASPTPPHVD